MAAKSRNKGKRAEREVVALARAFGLDAGREWHTAHSHSPTRRARDVRIEGDYFQVQVRASGFQPMYKELEGVKGFFFRRDRGEWLIALRAFDFLAILGLLNANRDELQPNCYRAVRDIHPKQFDPGSLNLEICPLPYSPLQKGTKE